MKNRDMFDRLAIKPRGGAPEMYQLTECNVVKESDAAVLVETQAGGLKWIPLSQVTKITRAGGEFKSEVRMTAWIAKQKGFRS